MAKVNRLFKTQNRGTKNTNVPGKDPVQDPLPREKGVLLQQNKGNGLDLYEHKEWSGDLNKPPQGTFPDVFPISMKLTNLNFRETYHHGRVVPLFVRVRRIRIDAVVDDLKGRHANGPHRAEVGVPEPTSLRTEAEDRLLCKSTCEG